MNTKASRVDKLITSAVALLCEIVHLYPARQIVLLERDMEYHYHIATVIGYGYRCTSLDVSRQTARSPLLAAYCREHGIGLPDPVVLVDSGFNGTVAKEIRQATGANAAIHLLCSFEPGIPGSEFAMGFLSEPPPSSRVARRHLVEQAVEHLPHNREASDTLGHSGGRLHARSRPAPAPMSVRASQFRTEVEAATMQAVASGKVAGIDALVTRGINALTCRSQPLRVLRFPAAAIGFLAAAKPLLGVNEAVRDLVRLSWTGGLAVAADAPLDGVLAPLRPFAIPVAAIPQGAPVISVATSGCSASTALLRAADFLIDDPPAEDRSAVTAQLDAIAAEPGGPRLLRDLLVAAETGTSDLVFSREAIAEAWQWAMRAVR